MSCDEGQDVVGAAGRLGWWLFFFVFLTYLLFSGETFEGYGEDTYQTCGAFAGWLARQGPPEALAAQGYYIEPLLGSPFYAVGALLDRLVGGPDVVAFRGFLFNAYIALQTSLAVVLVYVLGKDLYSSARTGLLVALIYGFGTMTFAYSGLGHETMLCLTLLASLVAIRTFRGSGRWRWVAAAGLLAGATAATKSYGVLFTPFLFVYFVLVAFEGRSTWGVVARAFVFVLCMAPFALGNLAYLRAMVAQTGHLPGGSLHWTSRRVPFGLLGMYWSAGKGFFVYNLPLILVLGLAGRFWRTHRREAIAFLFVAVYWSLFVAGFAPPLSFADEMWGTRYLYPFVPLGAVVLGCMVVPGAAGKVYGVLAGATALASGFFQWLARMWPKSYVTNVFHAPYINNFETWQFMPMYSPIRLRLYILAAWVTGRTIPLDYSPVYMFHHHAAGTTLPRWVLAVDPERFPPGVWWYGYVARVVAGEHSLRVIAPVVGAILIAAGAAWAGLAMARATRRGG